MDFEVGDRVIMDRGSSYFKRDMLGKSDPKLIWWGYLEDIQPLKIKKIDRVRDGLYRIYLEDTEYVVSNRWVKLFKKSNE